MNAPFRRPCRSSTASCTSRRQAILGVLAAGALFGAPPLGATPPGANGQLAYQGAVDPLTPTARSAIFLDGVQLTFPDPPGGSANAESDTGPVGWAPDGTQLAFSRHDQTADDLFIYLIEPDGDGLTMLISSDAFDQFPVGTNGRELAQVRRPTWSGDGEWIAFLVSHPGRASNDGLWRIRPDGTGLTKIIGLNTSETTQAVPKWAPAGSELAYPCGNDICVVDAFSGILLRRMPMLIPGSSSQGPLASVSWTPDGRRFLIARFAKFLQGVREVNRNEIYSMNADGTGLKSLTNGPETCPDATINSRGSPWLTDVSVSPDGELFVSSGFSVVSTGIAPVPGGPNTACLHSNDPNAIDRGLWLVDASGGSPSLLIRDRFASLPEWQPRPADLVVKVDDGYGHGLRGLKLELRELDGTVVDDQPLNSYDGGYGFIDVAPGDYKLRATLVDVDVEQGEPPSFDIRTRFELEPDEAVWIEQRVTVAPDEATVVRMSFKESPALLASNVEDEERPHLDDMANIYYRVRQFVDWVKANLTPSTRSTVEIYTFSTYDSIRRCSVDAPPGCSVDTTAAYYRRTRSEIIFGTRQSEYENRDGVDDVDHEDDAPENGEWHEFTHHLYGEYVDSLDCPEPFRNHFGYRNVDSCDSLKEGFANFLPALAAQSIDGVTDSLYDGFIDLETGMKAWNFRIGQTGRRYEAEDLAVPSLLWDLVDTLADTQSNFVIDANGQHRAVTYTDNIAIPLSQLWTQLTTIRPRTVVDLRTSFGAPPLTLDLDGDLVFDVAPLDVPFLMHGFHPIIADQVVSLVPPYHASHHYDIAAVNRIDPTAPRNNNVGLTNHRGPNLDGIETDFILRYKTEPADAARLAINVRDASGTPLMGAELEFRIRYPGILRARSAWRRAATGDADLVHLELPPYFDYLLPVGATLPACDPARDNRIEVTVLATLNGFRSVDQPVFDNCAYQRAIDTSTGGGALSLSLNFPEDSTPPDTSVATWASKPANGGATTGFWTVELTCVDPVDGGFASGCARSELGIDGGALVPYVDPVVIDQPGTHTVEFRSLDAASNAGATGSLTLTVIGDTDGDGIADAADNCTVLSNASQCDSDSDGYGNRCDADLNNNGTTNAQDYVLFRRQLGQPSITPVFNAADLNCDEAVNSPDYLHFRTLLGSQPGPAGPLP